MTRACLAAIAALGCASCEIPPAMTFTGPGGDGLGNGSAVGPPVRLRFVDHPTRGTVGEPLAAIRVAMIDDHLSIVPGADRDITLALGNNPNGTKLVGVLTTATTNGIASFSAVGLDRPGTGYTLVATAADLVPDMSTAFDVTAPAFVPVSLGIPGGPVSTVAVSPAPAGGTTTVFAGLPDGVYRSVDNGASWTRASFGLPSGAGTIVTDPRSPGVAYVVKGTSGGGFVSGPLFFVKKTSSAGDTWLDAGNMTNTAEASSVAIDPANPSTVYAGGSQLFRSADGGTSWARLTGLPFECSSIAIDPVTTTTLYCTVYDRAAQSWRGVYTSRDGGATWAEANTGLNALYTRGLLVAIPGAVFVASDALYRSTDGGSTWTAVPAGNAYALVHAPSVPTRMYLASGFAGVAVSNDGGASFGPPVSVGDVVQALAVDPGNPDRVYAAGGYNGVYVSSDGGASWSFSSSGIAVHPVHSVAMAPDAPDTVLVSTEFSPGLTGNGVYETHDGGASWTQVSTSLGIVSFARATSTRAYLCGTTFSISTDSGASFTGSGATGTGCTQLASAGSTLFAAGYPGGTRRSLDGGATWAATGLDTQYTYSVALGDGVGNVVVTGSDRGLYRSTDGGASVSQLSLDLVTALWQDPLAPTRIVAGLACGSAAGGVQANGGFRLSTDGGATFGPVINGPCVHQLVDNGSALYAVGRDYSAVSTDRGVTWRQLSPALSYLVAGMEATSIAASADGQTVYVGTTAGLYRSTTGGR